jgi:hypothetical protein
LTGQVKTTKSQKENPLLKLLLKNPMQNNSSESELPYQPLFELGIYEKTSPYCRVIPKEILITPQTLAALVTVLFETIQTSAPEQSQEKFEKEFLSAFKMMMEERFQYDLGHIK